jgi:hypothetical protein
MNVQAFEELKRVLAHIPERDFNVGNWHNCACGHARRDAWFQGQGFTSCYDFGAAAAFFGISHADAKTLFSSQAGSLNRPTDVITHVEAFLATKIVKNRPAEVTQHARRQAVIDGLLAAANATARKARRAATALVSVFL